MSDWGIPEWPNPHAYGDTTLWTKARWRWEFTRRRGDLRQDFSIYAEQFARYEEKLPARFRGIALQPHQRGFVLYVPESIDRYGLPVVPNPAISDQPAFAISFRPTYGQMAVGNGKRCIDGGQMQQIELPEGMCAISFQLSAPIRPQLKAAASQLANLQRKKFGKLVQRRARPEKRLGYLRVLDARESGASLLDIYKSGVLGKALRSNINSEDGPQMAEQVWGAARKLMFNWSD